MIKSKIAIIGYGPVGAFTSLLLQHFDIDFIIFEKQNKIRQHPSAHWVSSNSKLIFSQIPNLVDKIEEFQQNWLYFQHYRYVEKILGFQFGYTNHFKPQINFKLNQSKQYYSYQPTHIPQHKLLQIFNQFLIDKNKLNLSTQITSLQTNPINNKICIKNQNKIISEVDYVILSNGINSNLRDQIGINLEGNNILSNFINIHFKSPLLAEYIRKNQKFAMLYFIFNEKLPATLITHSLLSSQYVLQIMNYEPIIDLLQIYSAKQMILSILPEYLHAQIKTNIEIMHIGKWKLQSLVAKQMYRGRIILAGDTAHSYTPAGGFGMNCGFQDSNHLVHSLNMIYKNPSINKKKVLDRYSSIRTKINHAYMIKSLQNYQEVKNVQKLLGFPKNIADYFMFSTKYIPQFVVQYIFVSSLEQIRLKIMKMMYKSRKIQQFGLQLFFDEFDKKIQKKSAIQQKIYQATRNKQLYDFWISDQKYKTNIQTEYGHIENKNIKIHSQINGQEIIHNDGSILQI